MVNYSCEGLNTVCTRPTGGVKYTCEALETLWQDFLFSGPGGFFIQGRKKFSTLCELLPKVKKIASDIPDTDKIWVDKGVTIMTKTIMSKYLPDERDFAGCVSAIIKASGYFKQLKTPDKFEFGKFIKFFDNTSYVDHKPAKDISTSDAKLSSIIWNKPAQSRGWDSKQKYLKAINTCSSVLSAVQTMMSCEKTWASSQMPSGVDAVAKDRAKRCRKYLEITSELGCQLVRGVEQGLLYAVKSPLNKWFSNLIGTKE